MASLLMYLPSVGVIAALVLFSLVSAYVFRFGLPKTGIYFDYILFALFTVAALLLGGVI